MKIGILRELLTQETRCAITPDVVRAYKRLGIDVIIEHLAGEKAGFDDALFEKEGALITQNRAQVLQSDVVVGVNPPLENECLKIKENQILMADFAFENKVFSNKATVLALERVPRISRAQSMDILSSQSFIAGYQAAVSAMANLKKIVPLMMTSAATLTPVKALIIGAGVAGLQAISVLKRMGANVFATDIRVEAKEQVESVGGKFLEIFDNQKEMLSEELKTTDILITAAVGKGTKAPLLIDEQMLSLMPKGSVVIDVAGSNVPVKNNLSGICLIQNAHLERLLPVSASELFAYNVFNLISNYGGANLTLDFDDEIIREMCLCHKKE